MHERLDLSERKNGEKLSELSLKNEMNMTDSAFRVFKEYKRADGTFEYEWILGSPNIDIAMEFVAAISGKMRTYSLVITDRSLNVLTKYPATEIFTR